MKKHNESQPKLLEIPIADGKDISMKPSRFTRKNEITGPSTKKMLPKNNCTGSGKILSDEL